jgi:hypothetical protein
MRGDVGSEEETPIAGVLWRGLRGEFSSPTVVCRAVVLVLRGEVAVWRVWRARGEMASGGGLMAFSNFMRGILGVSVRGEGCASVWEISTETATWSWVEAVSC